MVAAKHGQLLTLCSGGGGRGGRGNEHSAFNNEIKHNTATQTELQTNALTHQVQ